MILLQIAPQDGDDIGAATLVMWGHAMKIFEASVMGRLVLLSASIAASPTFAQTPAAASPVPIAATDPVASQPAATPHAVEAPQCELHVWPTQNYIGVNMGLLSGFGVVGVLADASVHRDQVRTVKDLMAEYLGPAVQMEELDKLDVVKALKLNGYRVVVEEPTPFAEDFKTNPALKAKAEAMGARIRGKVRLSASTNRCYAELITTHIMYHKAMMYGSNLFTGWIYREFGSSIFATKEATGQVKNPLENFPPQTADMINPAKAELRDAYAKDFVEYVQKKVAP